MLPFPYQPGFEEADFLAAPSNEAALTWLDRTTEWPEHRLLLWGEAGCGKTHLLHLWAGRIGGPVLFGSALQGLPTLPPLGLAVDDADLASDETALFHLLNAAREAALPVLLAARTPPARWDTGLPDLASRLRAITAVEIRPPEEALLQALLARLLADRQLAVPAALQDWMLLRLPRTAAALREAVARLDADGRRIDRTLAASVLADLTVPDSA
ncbi:MAG: chromosomal replication initiator DnaA [Acetobacteraceae bacterium]|nr:chromosomal replication initiator DnaA [Acetobacteraceae bacterium]